MKIIFSVLLLVLLSLSARAQMLTQDFNFDGYLLDGSSNPITGPVSVKFQIYNPTSTCLLFEETHAAVTPATDGSFSLKIGTGTRASPGVDGGLTWKVIFQNSIVLRAAATSNCSPGYAPTSGDGRKLRVTVGATVLTPDYSLSAVPMATVAETLQGKMATDFVSTTGDSVIDGSLKLSNYGELRLHGAGSYYTGFKAPAALGTNTIYTMPSGAGSAGQCLAIDGIGNLVWQTVEMPGSGISSLNGLTGAAQTLNNGTAGTFPAWSSAGAIHTLNIPMADQAGVTGGLITKAQYDMFNSKMSNVTGSTSGNTLKWDGVNWVETNALRILGSGEIQVTAAPTASDSLTNKAYVDAVSAGSVSLAGDTLTGALTFTPSGTATNATVAFGNLNTGIYSPVSYQLGVTANGVEKMRVNGTGVGFGVTNPTSTVEINGGLKVGPGGAGSPVNWIQNFNAMNCTFTSLAPGATGTCTTALTSVMVADNIAMTCMPEGSVPVQPILHSCHLSANNTAMIVVMNAGASSFTPPNYWNITVTKF